MTGKWEKAKCLLVDISTDDIFFSDDSIDEFEATEFCKGSVDNKQCPLLLQCLRFSLDNESEYGVFGGTTPLARAAILKLYKKDKSKWLPLTEKEALNGLSNKELNDIRKRFQYEGD